MSRKQPDLTHTLTVAGISVAVTRKQIRHAYLRVKRLTSAVTLSVPYTMPDAEIARFVQAKSGWIRKQLEKPAPRSDVTEKTFAGGDTLSVWGQRYRLDIRAGTRYAIGLTGDTAVMTAPRSSTPARREAFAREWYRNLLKAEIPRLLRKWEGETGLKAADFRTKNMKTRWGSCNTKTAALWFSLQLAKLPPECLDYVVLHELLHLTERGHNKRFYALLARYMPGWKHAKAMLGGRQSSAGG